MISAKQFTLLANVVMSKDTNQYLNLLTAYGLIRGKIDGTVVNSLNNERHVIKAENQDKVEPISEFNVIALKDVTIIPSGNQTKISLDALTIFSDQIIAVFVGS
ncbi:hypothetical protein [Pelosinus propionicus]|uniref:Uncharacterized protein n=1 Tax=Pelosinus propionicus DSM 13327 TaxID=1123291 RepID=A0A1I4N3I9_9FIRM|nr:hypothetical protein [Pelosinus propionicus]SFM09897.1 hypothetical protein SAMN04490355_104073 [Pelosinus propionicus DSM 13327]